MLVNRDDASAEHRMRSLSSSHSRLRCRCTRNSACPALTAHDDIRYTLLFHVMLLLKSRGLALGDVISELQRRRASAAPDRACG